MNLIILLLMSVSALSNALPTPQSDYRLSINVLPEDYNLMLRTRIQNGSRNFYGTVEITLRFIKNKKEIVLHAKNLKIEQAYIAEKILNSSTDNVTHQYVLDYEINELENLLTLRESTKMVHFKMGTQWKLTITYTGELRNDQMGFYISRYNQTDFFVATNFEVGEARTAFPCFDEPNFSTNFTVTIDHGEDSIALSNMPAKNDHLETATKTSFLTSPRMSVNMLSIVIGKFNCHAMYAEDPSVKYALCVHATRHDNALFDITAFNNTAVMKKFNQYFNVTYPLPKLDFVALPKLDSIEAKSSWGLFIYPETELLPTDDYKSAENQRKITRALVNGYTRLWFDTQLTRTARAGFYIQEGLIIINQYIIYDQLRAADHIFRDYQINVYQTALNNDNAEYNIKQKAAANAAAIVNMWRNALGRAVWRRTLQIYLALNKYNTATEAGLIKAIAQALDELRPGVIPTQHVTALLRDWTQKPGYPVIKVTRNYTLHNFEIQQQPFLNSSRTMRTRVWHIPLNDVSEQTHNDFTHTECAYMLTCGKTKSITKKTKNISNTEWLILNKQATGYYRVNYDYRNWQLIIAGLNSAHDKMHAWNRAQLFSDAYALAQTAVLNYNISMELLTYLPNDKDYVPWATAEMLIIAMQRSLAGHITNARYHHFIKHLITRHKGSYYTQNARKVITRLGCLMNMDIYLVQAKRKLNEFIEQQQQQQQYGGGGGMAVLKRNMKLLCAAMRNVTDSVFTRVLEKMAECATEKERLKVWQTLACTTNPKQMNILMLKILKPETISSYGAGKNMLKLALSQSSSSSSNSSIGLFAAIDFIKNHYYEYNQLADDVTDEMIKLIAYYVVRDEELQQLLLLQNLTRIDLKGLVEVQLRQHERLRNEVNDWLLLKEEQLI